MTVSSEIERQRLVKLLRDIAAGNDHAFQEFYERTSTAVFALLKRMLRSEGQAEDILQDVYLAVWMRASEFRAARGSAMTWVITIARYRAISAIRKSGREIITDDLPEERTHENEQPLALAMGSADAALLHDCMNELGSEQRRSVELAFFQAATHFELAEALGKPLGTVKSWIRRGLQALKRCLSR